MDAAAWDAKYAAAGAGLLWSATPNRFLVQETEGLAPGRALDLACGEGRNALWLAAQGWQATGIDFSATALARGRAAAAERGEPASQWRRIGLLLNGVIAVDRRANEVGDTGATELPGDDLPIARSDNAEWNPCGNQPLQRRVCAGEELCTVPLIGAVPDIGRSLDKVLGDAEGGVHAAPVR